MLRQSEDLNQQTFRYPLVEKGAEVAHAIAPELVSLNRDKDLVLQEILDCSAAGQPLDSAQLMIKLPHF